MATRESKPSDGPCGFETLFAQYVPHILIKIFFSLDYESFKTCSEVNNAWRGLILSDSYQSKAKSVFSVEKVKDEEKLLQGSGEGGDIDEVRKLLATDMVDVNCQGRPGNCFTTPLGEAAYFGHRDIIKLLIDGGADLDKNFGCEDKTALHLAAMEGQAEVVNALLDAGADPNKADSEGRTPLYTASSDRFYKPGHKEVIKVLLERGADPNVASEEENGWTPLHNVACNGEEDLAELLLDHGADPHQGDDEGHTPLHTARYGEYCGIIHMMLTMDPLPGILVQTHKIRNMSMQ